jgi:hypothetical protein
MVKFKLKLNFYALEDRFYIKVFKLRKKNCLLYTSFLRPYLGCIGEGAL